MRTQQQLPRRASERFLALDLLRGVAALCVLVAHLSWPPSLQMPLPRAYLAVDLFFVLSGFVIAHAYEYKLGGAARFKEFVIARLIRLYPLYLLATVAVTAEFLTFTLVGSPGDMSLTSLALSFGTAALMLPTPTQWSVSTFDIFPLVETGWSLFFELIVNLLYGMIALQLRRRAIAIPIVAGLAALTIAASRYGTLDVGWQPASAWPGAARAVFSFFFGVAVFRLRKDHRAKPVPALLLAGMLVLVLIPQSFGWPYELACVGLLFPLLVWLGADANMSPAIRAVGNFLGYVSYPVYLLQVPILLALPFIPRWAGGIVSPTSRTWLVAQFAIIVAGSWIVARCFDTPVRAWLGRHFVRGAPTPAAQTAP